MHCAIQNVTSMRNTESNKHAHKFDLSLREFGMTAKTLNFLELKISSECYHIKQEKIQTIRKHNSNWFDRVKESVV